MKPIRIAALVVNQTPLDWEKNLHRLTQAIQEAKSQGAQLLLAPELCITGYGCEDAFYSPFVSEKALEILHSLKKLSADIILSVGLPMLFRGALFNVSALLCNEKIIGFIPKKHLASDGVHYENRWFKAWDAGVLDEIELENEKIPFGDYYFNIGGIQIGYEICEEAWVAKRTGAELSLKAVDIILNPSASHFSFNKQEVRKRFVTEGSRAFAVVYLYTNLLGNESGRIIFDGSALCASSGELIFESPRLGFKEFQSYPINVDIQANRTRRASTGSFKPLLKPNPQECLDFDFEWKSNKAQKKSSAKIKTWNESTQLSDLKNEEFLRSEAIGLFDYLRKSKSQGFCISLSGGVDSAVVLILSYLSFRLAFEELGITEFKKRLSHCPEIQKLNSIDQMLGKLIFCAYQATENSSQTTFQAAEKLAKSLHSQFYNWNIQKIVEAYHQIAETSLERKLSWEQDDIALQNIQARVRSPSIWFLTNLKNALLLSTSNRSESAVGYATMDGDTSGGLSPIAGVDKSFLIQWLNWISSQGAFQVSAISAAQDILKLPPTAELRPIQRAQTDEKDLMPYDVLNFIEKQFVLLRKSPHEISQALEESELQVGHKIAIEYVQKFLRLWARNQWKRERYAPAFHLDDESLDPKTWCRFPILSSGFIEECRELNKTI